MSKFPKIIDGDPAHTSRFKLVPSSLYSGHEYHSFKHNTLYYLYDPSTDMHSIALFVIKYFYIDKTPSLKRGSMIIHFIKMGDDSTWTRNLNVRDKRMTRGCVPSSYSKGTKFWLLSGEKCYTFDPFSTLEILGLDTKLYGLERKVNELILRDDSKQRSKYEEVMREIRKPASVLVKLQITVMRNCIFSKLFTNFDCIAETITEMLVAANVFNRRTFVNDIRN